jgi:hypothetical protein
MKDVKEYKVSFGFRIETNSPEVNTRTRKRTQHPMIPYMTVIGTLLQPIVSAILQYNLHK